LLAVIPAITSITQVAGTSKLILEGGEVRAIMILVFGRMVAIGSE
jgi:hypothetical protein